MMMTRLILSLVLVVPSFSAAATLEKSWLEPSVEEVQQQMLALPVEDRASWLAGESARIDGSELAQFQYRQLIADSHDYNDELDQYGSIILELEGELPQIDQLETKIDYLIQLGFLKYLERFEGCEQYQQAYELSRRSLVADLRVRAASKHAYCLIQRLSTLVEALTVLTEALDEANENQLPSRRKALLLSSLSQTYTHLLMYEEGKRANDESIRLFAEDGALADEVSGIYTGITSALHFSHDDDADEYLTQLNELRSRTDAGPEISFYYYQLLGAYWIQQQTPDYVAALAALKEAREFEESVPERYLVALNLTNILSAYIGIGDEAGARDWLAELRRHPEFSESMLFADRGPKLARYMVDQDLANAWRLTNKIVTDQHRAYSERFRVLRRSEALDNQNLADRYLINLHEQEVELERVRADAETAKNLVASRNQQLLVIALLFIIMILAYTTISRRTLKRLAHTDGLTKLMNRRAILKLLEQRSSSDHPTALALIDIDYFKRINDSYGHRVGDQVIREVAQVLKSSLASEDHIGRYGGEEFLVVMNFPHRDEVVAFADSLRERIAGYVFEGVSEGVTISIGCTLLDPNLSIEESIHSADQALYQAKRGGRNQSVWSRAYRPD